MHLDRTIMAGSNGLSPAALPELSKRQQEILAASALGASDKAIADQLQISTRTLEGIGGPSIASSAH
jgi:DNA-binding NarL/FixJ family response regulator